MNLKKPPNPDCTASAADFERACPKNDDSNESLEILHHFPCCVYCGNVYNQSMRKIILYLDTSVISHIQAPHKPEAEAVTHAFFRFVQERREEYELAISPVVEQEVDNCPEPKRSKLKTFLLDLDCVLLPADPEAEDLVEMYVAEGVLTAQHHNDLSHIAYAVVSDCDFIISWNFKHFVNDRTPTRVNAINAKHGYRAVTILSPSAFMEALTDANPET